jgi:hypothetical protein
MFNFFFHSFQFVENDLSAILAVSHVNFAEKGILQYKFKHGFKSVFLATNLPDDVDWISSHLGKAFAEGNFPIHSFQLPHQAEAVT